MNVQKEEKVEDSLEREINSWRLIWQDTRTRTKWLWKRIGI